MTDSLLVDDDRFRRLRWSQVRELVSVLQGAQLRDLGHIRRMYLQQSENFEETRAFLDEVAGGRTGQKGTIDVEVPSDLDEGEIRVWILRGLVGTDNSYRRALFSYLQTYNIEGGVPRRRPRRPYRHYESNVRNFLIDLGVIGHDVDGDYYFVRSSQIDLYLAAQDWAGPRQTPARRALLQVERESFGTAAERSIVEYEKSRLGGMYQDAVRHVALVNAAAGYDVRSLTIEAGRAAPRLIEVKAVERRSLRFYWTRNEMEASRRYGEWYYLYLLPVSGGGGFVLEELTVIPDPAIAVLGSGASWEVESDGVQCRKRLEVGLGTA